MRVGGDGGHLRQERAGMQAELVKCGEIAGGRGEIAGEGFELG